MNNFNQYFGSEASLLVWIHSFGLIIFLLTIWSLFWKGLALWHSGRREQVRWFLVFIFLNTVGILEIIYLFGVLKLKPGELFSKKK